MIFSIKNSLQQIKAKKVGNFTNFEATTVSIDSRSLQNGADTLFFALRGKNNDAHNYLNELITKGVRYFVVEYIPEEIKTKANFFVVSDTKKALQQMAQTYKQQFTFLTLAITGSNGKTIVKEWLNFLLSPDYNIAKSPKSYNSQVGVPLSIFGINEKHTLGIFEAGISEKNEMTVLEKIIQPNIGVFTHISNAHNEGFTSEEEKIIEKTKLFKNCNTVILQANKLIEKHIKSPVFTWSFTATKATVFAKIKHQKEQQTSVEVNYKNSCFSVVLPFNSKIAIENAMTCIATLLYLKVPTDDIIQRVKNLYLVEIRLQAKTGINNCTLIDDSFSSDYQSLKIALDFLEQQKQHQQKTIILSDIFQSGLPQKKLYNRIEKHLKNSNFYRIIVIGKTISKYLNDLSNVVRYPSTEVFLKEFNLSSFKNETILIKGARNFKFDKIVVSLEEKKHETVLEINLNAVAHNFSYYKSLLKPKTKVMAMVKAFGYGSGSYEIAKLLSHNNIDYLGVAFVDEGVALRKAGITVPIMVLNPEKNSFSAMITYKLEPEIYSIKQLKQFIITLQERGVSFYPIHLKIDTGMHRLGFEEKDCSALLEQLNKTNSVTVTSIFSHLAASDNVIFNSFTQQQYTTFLRVSSQLIQNLRNLRTQPIRHIVNTSGILNFPEMQLDMVRLGIGLYGIGKTPHETNQLQNVGTLKSIISQIKIIEKGESIGYNRTYYTTRVTRLATIPIGYADGIKRAWGNQKGYVIINEKKATILGAVCMDMLMVDVTNIECTEGDVVIIFGKEPLVTEIAKTINTIPYEVITSISSRVKRVFYRE